MQQCDLRLRTRDRQENDLPDEDSEDELLLDRRSLCLSVFRPGLAVTLDESDRAE